LRIAQLPGEKKKLHQPKPVFWWSQRLVLEGFG